MASKIAIQGGFAKRREWEPTRIVVERSETFQTRSARTTPDLPLAKPLR
jgi:hypothetical protein